jgi:type IV pilus assembly protein PilV
MKRNRTTAGFTLLEVLVALFVLSVGLLGAARLEIISLRSVTSSSLRSQAVSLAYDMSDRMRANARGMTAANGTAVGFYNAADAGSYVTPADNACTETATQAAATCTVAEMAAHDLWEWGNTLGQFLPGGAGVTCIDSTPNDGSAAAPACDNLGSIYAVKVWWTDVEQDGTVTKRLSLLLRP